jgi:hypothetical protein
MERDEAGTLTVLSNHRLIIDASISIDDPDVRTAFDAKYRAFKDDRRPADVLVRQGGQKTKPYLNGVPATPISQMGSQVGPALLGQ